MAAPDVTKLQQDIDNERLKFLGLRQKLATALGAFKPPAEMPDQLVAYAEEFGAEEAVKRLGTEPTHFKVDVPAAVRKEISPLLLSIVDASNSLDSMIGQREEVLCAADPARERRYMSFGREFTLDASSKKIRYVDGGEEPMNLVAVEPRHAPGMGPRKGKGRGRSM
jgi:hypothetical protein